MEELKDKTEVTKQETSSKVLEWFQSQVSGLQAAPTVNQEEERANQQRLKDIEEVKAQQAQLSRKLALLEGRDPGQENPTPPKEDTPRTQEAILQQLRLALAGKKEEDPNKALLRAPITSQNKTTGEGGTSTLKPTVLNSILSTKGNNMAEWLANLNKQDEGESDLARLIAAGEGELKGLKGRSGILDKATTNIQQKQVWPQQNLGEDWADEDVEFKQMKFEHMVAGETRTIETCTDPTQILGRLRLLHRIAYLKLRGYEWNLIRKMYAAILL